MEEAVCKTFPRPPGKRPSLLVLVTQTRRQELSEDFRPHGEQQSALVLQKAGDRAGMCLPTWFEPIGEGPRLWNGRDLP